MNFQPLIVAGKKLNENAYQELPQDSMNTGEKNYKSCSTSDSSVHSSIQFEAASSNSNLSAAIKQERQLAEARQAARRRKTFAYDGDISTEIHLTFGISSTEMPSKSEESLQPHSTSSGQSLRNGTSTLKPRSDNNVSSHKKRSENERRLEGDNDIECEKNVTSRSGRFDKVVGASEANYQKINSAAEGNKDVDRAILIESNSSKGDAVASENPSYASRNSSRKKSISAQFSSDKKVEKSVSRTSNSVPSTVNVTVQQFSTSISALNFDEKCSSSFEKAVIKEREEANARQLARRRKTLKSGSNYDEIHLTKEMMQTTSSSNIAYTTTSNSQTKSADVNSKAHGISVDEDDRMHKSAATHRTRKCNSLTKADDSKFKALDISNLGDVDDRMHTVATRRTRKSNSQAKSDDSNSKALGSSNLMDDNARMHTSGATHTTRKDNSRPKSVDLNSKAHGTSNLVEDDRMLSSVTTHRTRKSNSRAKSDDFSSKAPATLNLVDDDGRMHTSGARRRTRKSNFQAKSDDSNPKALGSSNLMDDNARMHTSGARRRTRKILITFRNISYVLYFSGSSNLMDDNGRMHITVATHTRKDKSRTKSDDFNSKAHGTSNLVEDDKMLSSVAMHRTRKSNSRVKSDDSNSRALDISNLVDDDGRMHTSGARRRTRKRNSQAKSDDSNSKALDISNLVDDDGRMHTSGARRRTRKRNSQAKSDDSNSKALGSSNLMDDNGRMHISIATHATRKDNSRTKSVGLNSKAHGTSNLVEDDRMLSSVATHRTRKSNSRVKSGDFISKAPASSNLVEEDGRMHTSVVTHTRRKDTSRAKSGDFNSKAPATSSLVKEVDKMRTSIAPNRTSKSNSRAKSGDFTSKTLGISNLEEEDDRMHTSLSSALTVVENSKRQADNSNLVLWNATSESKLAVALPVQDLVFEKTPTTRSKKRCFPFSSTPSTNFKKAEVPDVPFLGDLSTIISLRAPDHEKIKKIKSGMKSRAGSKSFANPELVESVPRVDCNNDDATKTALIASSILENSEKIADNGSLSNEGANGKQTIPEVVPAQSFHSPVPCNVQRKNKHKKRGRRGKKNIKRYPAFSTPNLQSGKGDVMKYPAFSSSEFSSITSLPAKDANSLKSMDCKKTGNQSKAFVAKNSLSQSSRKQRLSCESTEKQSKRASLKSNSQVCDIAAAGNDFGDIETVISENVQQSDAESCQTNNADSDQVMKRSSECKEIEEIDSKRLADLVSAMSENASVTPISYFKKPSGSLDHTAILKRFGVDSECDDILYEEEIDEFPANRKNLSVIQQSASEKEEPEEKMSCIAENTNLLFEKDALSLQSDNLSVGQKRSSTTILHDKTKEVSNENGTSSASTSFHSETECSESIYPVNVRCKKIRKLSTSTERSNSAFMSGSENDSGIVTPKRHPRSTTLFEQLMRRRISSAMNKAASSTERSILQKNAQSASTSMNDTSIKHYYEQGTPNVSLGYASELPTPKINWGDLRKKTPNVRRSNRTRIPTLRRQLGESVVYRYVNGLPEVERVIHGTVMGKVFLRYGAANSAALVEARRRRRRFLEYRRKMKKLQRERSEALRRRRLSVKESQSSVMG
ncbi:hypothetical protein T4C_13395 [Trichinella pseudospiralis]|uniref:Uncharacterized protein n=1 Tax=Trichinella pseudospiralis TaxID=6337 RepID=A0A0V1JVB9_TRIPS|nr:hypothetical protein T4C_13395 [Trichinella pseudospiralis]